ncbi:MAG: hypothetical protein ACXWLC_07930, partial [Rhizomicrobium sp.]
LACEPRIVRRAPCAQLHETPNVSIRRSPRFKKEINDLFAKKAARVTLAGRRRERDPSNPQLIVLNGARRLKFNVRSFQTSL